MKKSDIGLVAFLYAVGLFFLKFTFDLPEGAQAYPLFLITVLLGLTTLYLVVQLVKFVKTRSLEDDFKTSFSGFKPLQFLGVFAACIAFLALIYWAGYYIAATVFLVGTMLFLRVKPLFIVLATIVMMALVYVVFSWFLKVPLPVGALFAA